MELAIVDGEEGPMISSRLYPAKGCLYRYNRPDGSHYYDLKPSPHVGYSNPSEPPATVLREVQTLVNAYSETASALGVPITHDWTIRDLLGKLTAHTKVGKWPTSKQLVCPTCGRKLD